MSMKHIVVALAVVAASCSGPKQETRPYVLMQMNDSSIESLHSDSQSQIMWFWKQYSTGDIEACAACLLQDDALSWACDPRNTSSCVEAAKEVERYRIHWKKLIESRPR